MYKNFFKRIIDFTIVFIALLIIWPILLIITIWLHFANKGAGAFFTQERPGKDGKIFKVIKFKSMTDERDENGNLLPDVQRLTKVGKFVRKTSIDELPQLINVLKGDMALIGPRPLTPIYLQLFNDFQKRRMEVRPGITGWAQINGRNHCMLSKKFEYDVWYVDNVSIKTDLKILLLTILCVVKGSDVGDGAGDAESIDDLGFMDKYREILQKMKKEIGSNFWLSDEDIKKDTKSLSSPSIFNCDGSDYVWLSTCRSAISLVIQTIEERNPNINKRVCLPAFTCNTVFEPFINAGYEFYPLNVGKDLGSNAQDLLNTILESKVGIVLFHRYFGFDTLYNIDSIIPILQKNGISIIEDCTQSMYSNIDRINADYYVGSIRKWCGVPDGGFAVCKHGYFSNKPQSYDIDLEKAKYEACIMKYNFLFNNKGKKEDFLIGYREAEDILDKQDRFYNIAPLSIKVQSNLDVDWMKNKRQENYRTLLNLLNKSNNIIPVFEELPENVVPLYFPILCMNRKEIQSTLVQNSIYAPIVWPKDEKCPKISIDSDYIYDHILCIPIDQRYSSDDMERVAEILNNFN